MSSECQTAADVLAWFQNQVAAQPQRTNCARVEIAAETATGRPTFNAVAVATRAQCRESHIPT